MADQPPGVPSPAKLGQWNVGEIVDHTPTGKVVRVMHSSSGSRVIGVLTDSVSSPLPLPSSLVRTHTLSLAALVDIAHDDSSTLFVYEGALGLSFAKVSEHRLLPFETALSIGLQICEALREIHAQGGIHGAPYYEHLTTSGDDSISLIGALSHSAFKSPCKEELKYLDPLMDDWQNRSIQSDLYAVAIVLYRLATGQFPFTPSSVEEVRQRASNLPPAIGKRSSNWPIAGFDVLNRATSLDRSLRFETATQLRNALSRLSSRRIVEIQEPQLTAMSGHHLPSETPFSRAWLGALVALVLLTAWSFVR